MINHVFALYDQRKWGFFALKIVLQEIVFVNQAWPLKVEQVEFKCNKKSIFQVPHGLQTRY